MTPTEGVYIERAHDEGVLPTWEWAERIAQEVATLRDALQRKIQYRVVGSDGGSGWQAIPEAERSPWVDLVPGQPVVFGNGWGKALELETRVAPFELPSDMLQRSEVSKRDGVVGFPPHEFKPAHFPESRACEWCAGEPEDPVHRV